MAIDLLMQYLVEPAGLYALLALIPLILIYLIRPKPKKKVIPALMFLIKETGKSPIKSFFQQLLKDLLLLLQILLIVLIALSLAKPFVELTRPLSGDEAVIIIDGSASSQTKYGSHTRFDEEIDLAMDVIGRENTIIIAGAAPAVVAEKVDSSKARSILESLKPMDTPSNIYDALIVASNYVGSNGVVFVFSDFIQTVEGLDYNTAKELLETKGAKVVFKKVYSEAKNIGIIDVEVDEENTIVTVKNYNDDATSVKVKVGDLTEDLDLGPKASDIVSFKTPRETAKIELIAPSGLDNLAVDDEAYVTFPKGRNVKVLLLTNNQLKYLPLALGLLDYVDLTIATPPQVPDIQGFDMVITQNVDGSLILPGVMKDIKKQVESGGSLVITGQDRLFQVDFLGLMPVKYNSLRKDANIEVDIPTAYTNDVDFGYVSKHFDVDAKDGTSVLASTTEGIPILVLSSAGDGKVLYYGIFDDESSFKTAMYYPIFWKRLIDYMTEQVDIKNLNRDAGDTIIIGRTESIRAPDGTKFKDSKFRAELVGVYQGERDDFAVSLNSEQESDVNGEDVEQSVALKQETSLTEKRKEDLSDFIIWAALAVVLLELLLVKLRGDI